MIEYLPAFAIIITGFVYSLAGKKLTLSAAITGAIIGSLLMLATGYTGLLLMTIFFLVGSMVTSWKIQYKKNIGLAEDQKGLRNTWQVLANSGAAAIVCLLLLLQVLPTSLARLLVACSFSSAISDTVSSELGNVYGKRFYNILSLKKDTRGLNGVISLEGTFSGVVASILLALVYGWLENFDIKVPIVIIAGTIGNLADSILGATVERKGILGNNTVNFLNTIVAMLAGWLLYLFA